MTPSRKILLMMSGSIACAKATTLISTWRKAGHAVRVACTPSVRSFVGSATLEGLSGEPVFDDTFTSGRIMDHVELARWADMVVVCPATSNLLNKLAAGIADEAVSTLWQAAWGRGLPMFIVPAMNTRMWNYPATREAVRRLGEWGAHVLPVGAGALACGEQGEGRMLEPERVIDTIESLLSQDAPGNGCRVLVTAGGTRELIDAVRHIGNGSSGRTAAVLTDRLVELGCEVTWLGAADAVRPSTPCRQETFVTFSDLDTALGRLLGEQGHDGVVHLAAVSDFHVAGIDGHAPGGAKLGSNGDLVLRLAPNPKLLNGLKARSLNDDIKVIGFKLTVGAGPDAVADAVARQFGRGGVDAIVHNDLETIGVDHHPMRLHESGGDSRDIDGPRALAEVLVSRLGRAPGYDPSGDSQRHEGVASDDSMS
ncbi:bifunctional phosphopantothenoylcysteine decarboxylase/phosphopantothenate--cysteine ligase CoaBC [Marinihelvus fidelis]|uniref:Coenzyme A biosynthesis bifunctional protein CoaBC n=1 Tax=Marinihelvus fidelis TaxID=2613842 RepID=A0A5N0TAK8_9GAMM|nr:bifunctional phosphopantothenoylcysteine decarboxylase/phosphopantothenate--cysteine ligase CoaBC [Marinihelvus fidelis]KAA9132045.1 bifunctional phosphopantothenoylcysteine decarboxylase/phosphopantothenate--cysteine ligase CoaBC [Marinihelvus fidelis]